MKNAARNNQEKQEGNGESAGRCIGQAGLSCGTMALITACSVKDAVYTGC